MPRNPKTLAWRWGAIIMLPLLWQLGLVGGFLRLFQATDDYIMGQDHQRTRVDEISRWGAAHAALTGAISESVQTKILPDKNKIAAYEKDLQKACDEAAPSLPSDQAAAFKQQTADTITNVSAAIEDVRAGRDAVARNRACVLGRAIIGFTSLEPDNSGNKMTSRYRLNERQWWSDALTGASCINLFALVMIASLFNRDIITRLKIIQQNSRALAEGQALPAPMKGNDEIAQLDRNFHDMAAAIKESTRAQTAMIENSRDIICSVDEFGRFVAVSDASSDLLGLNPRSLERKSMVDFVVAEEQDVAVQKLRALPTQGDLTFEVRMLRADGAAIDTLWSATWAEDDRTAFCVVHDNSAVKANERLQQEIVQMVSHDLRSPLSAISGFYQILETGALGTLEPTAQTMLAMATRNVSRMSDLTEDLLDMQKLEAGRLELQRKTISLEQLFQGAIESCSLQARHKQIAIQQDVPAGLKAYVDAHRITQVLVNVVTNAIKFSPPNSLITLHGRRDPSGGVHISVTDQGRGIPESELSHVFDRFHQTHADDAKNHTGSGLGLAICKALVDLHGGEIYVRSKVGQGSTFEIVLPSEEQSG